MYSSIIYSLAVFYTTVNVNGPIATLTYEFGIIGNTFTKWNVCILLLLANSPINNSLSVYMNTCCACTFLLPNTFYGMNVPV